MNKIVIGQVARIQRSQRQDFVLKLIAKLRENGFDPIAVFAGECREFDYLQELREYVEENKLSNNVAYLGRRDDILNVLHAIDFLIIPSSFEGFPLAGLEAVAAGVPVLGCNMAGAKEFVDISNAGVVFEDEDLNAAMQGNVPLISNQKKYSQNATVFAQKWGIEAFASKVSNSFCAV